MPGPPFVKPYPKKNGFYSALRGKEVPDLGDARDEREFEAEQIRTDLAHLNTLRSIPFVRSARRLARKRERLERRLRELEQSEILPDPGEPRPPLWDR